MCIFDYNISKRQSKFEIRRTKYSEYYSVLIAENGKTIATSEMYENKNVCEKGIESVKVNAPKAEVLDTTK